MTSIPEPTQEGQGAKLLSAAELASALDSAKFLDHEHLFGASSTVRALLANAHLSRTLLADTTADIEHLLAGGVGSEWVAQELIRIVLPLRAALRAAGVREEATS